MVDPDSDRIPRVPPYSGTILRSLNHFAYGGFTLFARLSQNLSAMITISYSAQLNGRQPYNTALMDGLGSSNFARRYFRNHYYFLFPGYLDGSVPPVSLPYTILFTYGWQHLCCRVTPFGYQRITGCLLLPVNFRSLPRPSSPQYAKASTLNPSFAWPYYPSSKKNFVLFSIISLP